MSNSKHGATLDSKPRNLKAEAKEHLQETKFKAAELRIQTLALLEPNWDSCGSAPPNKVAVGHALTALRYMRMHHLPVPRINPSSDEGVLFELERENERILLDFYNSGEIVLLRRSANHEQARELSEAD